MHKNIYAHRKHGWCIGSSGNIVTDSCEPPSRCWELNPGPLEEQPVKLPTAEPFPQPSTQSILKGIFGIYSSPLQRVSTGKAGVDAASEAVLQADHYLLGIPRIPLDPYIS